MHGKKAIAVLCALCCAAAAAACTPDLAAPQQVYEITMGSPVFDQGDIRHRKRPSDAANRGRNRLRRRGIHAAKHRAGSGWRPG